MASKLRKCSIDTHPQAEEIAGWLRAGMTAVAINANIKELNPDSGDIAPAILSRHRSGCLGLAKLSKGRGAKATQTSAEVAEQEVPDLEDVRDYALRVFYDRIKRNPADVGTKELVSLLGAMYRQGAPKGARSAVEEAMRDLIDNDEETPPS